MKLSFASRCLAIVAVASVMTACGTVEKYMPGKKADYKQSRSEASLEVPPDLSTAGIEDTLVIPSATYSEYESEAGTRTRAAADSTVLPDAESIEIRQDGDKRWMVVQAPPEQVWPQVRDFWIERGFLLTVEDPRAGILETEWAENRADIPQGPIRGTIGRALGFLYSAATRDKFRIRLERGEQPGTTEVYLTHRGMEEVVEGTPDESEGTVWKRRPSDPELEAEMLQRLMVYMGAEEERAKTLMAQQQDPSAPRAELIQNDQGEVELQLSDDFSRAWRRTGIALDRVGFTVEDRNRSEGIFYVRYNDPLKADEKRGLLSRLAFWSDDEEIDSATQYQIKLTSAGARTQVVVHDDKGQRDNSRTARRILTLLEEQLK